MIPVFQTIVDKGRGDCMRAVVASLLDVEDINILPNYRILGPGWFLKMAETFKEYGYPDICYISRCSDIDLEFLKQIAKFDNGINGYFYGTVKSQTFDDTYHAVVVDSDLNIVHGPNPNQLAMKLTPDDVLGIYVHGDIIIDPKNRTVMYLKDRYKN